MPIIIIDGSNVVRMGVNNVRFNYDLEQVKENEFISILNKSNATYSIKKEVYFDGPNRKIVNDNDLTDILFSKYKKADDLIVNAVAEHSQNYLSTEIIVVTSDTNLQQRCLQYNAYIVNSKDFIENWLDKNIMDIHCGYSNY